MSDAPVESARYSRPRETASWMTIAAIGARITPSRTSSGLPLSSSPPPKMSWNWPIWARKLIVPPIVAAIVPMSVSRFFTWLSSWARTPMSCRSSMASRRPVVTAIAACFGSRPVANALGSGRSTR